MRIMILADQQRASFLGAGEYGGHLGPKREEFLAFVRSQLVHLARVAQTRQVGFLPPACQRLANAPAGRRRISVQFTPVFAAGVILSWGVARRSFGLVRLDLWLQFDPFASDPELVTS
jgi:hypothetical protein